MNPSVPVIALVGRPNVGKSTLFNRLTRSRDALVANIPGLTRDRHYGSATLDGQRVVLIDTGGFEPVAATGVAEQMARQTRQAVIEADVVVFVVDGRQGLLARDEEIAQELRRTARKVVLAVNKCEGISRPVAAAEFHALGLGVPMPISATHGDGVHALMEECLEDWRAERERLLAEAAEADAGAADEAEGSADGAAEDAGAPGEADQDGGPANGKRTGDAAEGAAGKGDAEADERKPVRVAVVGRPNGGKSTLINALLGEERLIAFNQPGTTRDSITVAIATATINSSTRPAFAAGARCTRPSRSSRWSRRCRPSRTATWRC